jgi:hypothetical protein
MPLNPGTKLGRYEIQSPLGAGGMGEAYRARDTRLERTVAIKILSWRLSNDPARKQRFEREAKTISSLNHPHICVLYDIGHQEGTDYLVMECVEGETLAKRLEKGPLPVEQVLKYGAQTETGSMEVYVSPFLSGNGKWQVSSGGGEEPRWRQDGEELFYLSPEGKMMAVALTTSASFKADSAVALFQTHRRQPVSAQDLFSYDVSGDGQRLLIITKMDEANATPLSIHMNWASEMEK